MYLQKSEKSYYLLCLLEKPCKAVFTCSSNMNGKRNGEGRAQRGVSSSIYRMYNYYLRKVQPTEVHLQIREMSGTSRLPWCCRGAQMGHFPDMNSDKKTVPISHGVFTRKPELLSGRKGLYSHFTREESLPQICSRL